MYNYIVNKLTISTHIMRQSLVTVDFVENKSNNIITQALT